MVWNSTRVVGRRTVPRRTIVHRAKGMGGGIRRARGTLRGRGT